MKIGLYYRVLIKDKEGKTVKRTHWKESKSFVLQFLGLFDAHFSHPAGGFTTAVTVKDTAGASRSMGATAYAYGYGANLWAAFAPNSNDTYGIQVGTGTTAPTNIDYKLETKISTGVGAGNLSYGTHSKTTTQVVGSNVDFVFSRSFYNGSGNTVTVNEIGIVVYNTDSTNPGVAAYILLARDVITPVDVANAQTLTVQYTFRTTA